MMPEQLKGLHQRLGGYKDQMEKKEASEDERICVLPLYRQRNGVDRPLDCSMQLTLAEGIWVPQTGSGAVCSHPLFAGI